MEGKAGVLASEIKMDKGSEASTEKKEEELADLQTKVQTLAAAQVSTLAEADKQMKEAANADSQTKVTTATKSDKTDNTQEKVKGMKENIENVTAEAETEISQAAEFPITEMQSQQAVYARVDIRL